MPITSGQLTVGTSAVQVDGSSTQNFYLHIHNNSNTQTLYIGGDSAVSSSTGLHLMANDSIELQMGAGDNVWVISSSSGHPVSWMIITQD